ncbi:hypothetical protein HanIR_Chr06g0256801 [Helianthus annuus]|nr:hypothetical protein HanIR_Chr06g0256801 [Helianthus annuus]
MTLYFNYDIGFYYLIQPDPTHHDSKILTPGYYKLRCIKSIIEKKNPSFAVGRVYQKPDG